MYTSGFRLNMDGLVRDVVIQHRRRVSYGPTDLLKLMSVLGPKRTPKRQQSMCLTYGLLRLPKARGAAGPPGLFLAPAALSLALASLASPIGQGIRRGRGQIQLTNMLSKFLILVLIIFLLFGSITAFRIFVPYSYRGRPWALTKLM